MVHLFGPEVEQSLKILKQEMARTRAGEKSELMEILIAKRWAEMFGHLSTDPIESI
jgi:ethylbenzene hydroxylase subunit beta/complex iron-sulfur molybdoenzyme family reductase subunit beta